MKCEYFTQYTELYLARSWDMYQLSGRSILCGIEGYTAWLAKRVLEIGGVLSDMSITRDIRY